MQNQLSELNSIESALCDLSSHASTSNSLQEAYSILDGSDLLSEISDVQNTINTNISRLSTFRNQV